MVGVALGFVGERKAELIMINNITLPTGTL